MSDTAWFVLADGRRRGPFATAELQQVLLRHPDPGAQLVWHSGLTEWVPAHTRPEFAPSLPPQPPQTKTMSEFPSERVSPAVVVNTEERHSVKSKRSKCWTLGGLAVGLLLFQIVRPQIWGNDTPFPNWEMLASGLWTAFSVVFGAFVGRLVEGATIAPAELAPLVPPQPPRTNTNASPAVIHATNVVPGPVHPAVSDDFPSEAI